MSPRWRMLSVLMVLSIESTSCGSFNVGERKDLDAGEIARDAKEAGFAIPDGFEFGQALTYTEFVGQPAWAGRFDGPAALGDGSAMKAANPNYPKLQPMTCDAVPPGSWAALGFTCVPETLMTRSPPAGGADSVTVLLTHDAQSAHLFVYSSGN